MHGSFRCRAAREQRGQVVVEEIADALDQPRF
jgi:hypothetical protein